MDERNYGSLEACQRLDAAAIVRSTDVDCKTKEVGNEHLHLQRRKLWGVAYSIVALELRKIEDIEV